MEQTNEVLKTTKKVYKDREIWVGTFIGGPLVAGYFIVENFKVFNEADKIKKTWIYTIIGTVIIFAGIFMIPDSIKIPNQIIPIIYTFIAYYIVQHLQGRKITEHINAGGQIYSWWRTIAVGIIGLVILIIPVLGLGYLYKTATSPEKSKTYGVMKHEITFVNSNITESEVDKIADGLIKTSFFDEVQQKFVFVKKDGKKYILEIPVIDGAWDNIEAIGFFKQLRNDIQVFFPDNKIIIGMCKNGTFDHDKKNIE